MSDVRDASGTYRSTRGHGYNTRSALDFHPDGSDIVGLMCLQTAKAGGENMISSSNAAYNVMLAERPDLARELYGQFTFRRHGEQAPEEPRMTRRQSSATATAALPAATSATTSSRRS